MRINQAGPKDDDDERQVPPTETWGGRRVMRADGHTQSETTISPHFWLLTNLCRETRKTRRQGQRERQTNQKTDREKNVERERGKRGAEIRRETKK